MTALRDSASLVDEAISPGGRVSIRLASAEVRLTAVGGDRVTIRTLDGVDPGERLAFQSSEGEVAVRERDVIGLAFGKLHKTLRLDVTVPVAADTTVDIASGRIEARGLAGHQRYRTASGDVDIANGAGSIDVSAVSGDVSLALAGSATLSVRTVSGDVAVAGGSLESLQISTTSGDVRVDSPITGTSGNAIQTLSGDATVVARAGISVIARTVSGDLSSDLPHRSDGRTGRRTLVVGDGRIELSFRSVSGDLRIEKADVESATRMRPAPPASPERPVAPEPPVAPTPPTPPVATATQDRPADAAPEAPADPPFVPGRPSSVDDERMAILRALERGELDIATSMDRLADLDDREGEGQPDA